ncbi:MAG: isoprenylcysteine carboxylmethyltransferase family protein [Verrucomicrobiota bacterium]
MARFFDWFQLAVLGCLACLGIGRALVLRARGVRVIAIDWQRTPEHKMGDLLTVMCLLAWFGETVAQAWPLPIHFVPQPLRTVLMDAAMVKAAGAVMMLAGLLSYGLALRALGDSWRGGIDRKSPGPLVTCGIYAWTRNPIYASFDLLAAGTFLMQGRLIFLMLALGLGVMLHIQIRREERFLTGFYGDAYREYCARVGRYLKWR